MLSTVMSGSPSGVMTKFCCVGPSSLSPHADLPETPHARRLARAQFPPIHHYPARAFGYNVAATPLAALGFLNPVVASAAMTLSSVFVVANSLRLQRYPLRAPSDE